MKTETASEIASRTESRPASSGILAIWNDREDAIAELYERWYLSEHLPERLGVPGFFAARRYETATGVPRFFTWYDVESPAVLSSADYLARLAAPSALTREVMANFRNMMRTVCSLEYRSPGATLGGCVVAAYVEQPARIDDRRLLDAAIAYERDAGVLGVQAWRAVHDPAHAVTSEAKLRPGGDRRIEAALIVELLREEDGERLKERVCDALRACVSREESASPDISVRGNVYRLLGIWQSDASA